MMSADYFNMHQGVWLLYESGHVKFASLQVNLIFILIFKSITYAVWLKIESSGMSDYVVVHTSSWLFL